MRRFIVFLFCISLVLANSYYANTQGMRRPGMEGARQVPMGGQKRQQMGRLGEMQDLVLKEAIDINSLRLGHSFPNILKAMFITVDETTGNIYLAGSLTHSIYEVNPETGKVLRTFETGLSGINHSNLAVDSKLRMLYYVTTKGDVISFDLGTGQKKGQYSYKTETKPLAEREEGFPMRGKPGQGEGKPGQSKGRFGEGALGKGKFEEGVFGTESSQGDVPPRRAMQERQRGSAEGSGEASVFPDILVDKVTNRLLVACRDDLAIYVFDDRANLVKKIPLQISPITMYWSDYLNSAVVTLGTKRNPEMRFLQLNINEGTTRDLLSLQMDIPERWFTIDEKGNYYLVGQSLSKIEPSEKSIWSVGLQSVPIAVAYNSGIIALAYKDGHAGKDEGGKVSCIDFYNCEDGAYLSTVPIRYEVLEMVIDKVHGRLMAGNGGDASFSVIDWNNKRLINTYRLGSAVEQVVYNKGTDDLYILNRLGGSELYRYNLKTKRFDTLIAGGWPVRMALSSNRKRLYVLSHYEAKVYVINPQSFSVIEEIPLGIAGSKTDSISDMAFNDESGILVAGFPETADLVILNVDTKNVVKIKPSGIKPLPDEGPGRWQVQASKDGKNVLLYCHTEGKLIQYNISGNEIASISVNLMPKKTYGQEIFRCLPSTGELYLGSCPVSLNPLSIGTANRFVHRVLDIKGGILYGNRIERDGQEILCLVDINSGMPLDEYRMLKTEVIHSNPYFSLEENIYFATDMANAKVYQYEIPVLTTRIVK